MSRARFIADVRWHGGFPSDESTGQAVDAVMNALGDALAPWDAERVAGELPDWLGAPLRRGAHRERTPRQFIAAVAAAQGVPPGIAREQAGVVLQALVEELTADGRRYLDRALRPALRELTVRRDETSRPPPPVHPHRRSTLSIGRLGSSHPVSASRPRRAHGDSVAASDDPHGDRKLSEASAAGDSIASAHPGTKTPLSEGS